MVLQRMRHSGAGKTHPRMSELRNSTQGRWRDILLGLGVDRTFLGGKHTGCPMCGGKDRFRWDNKDGHGTFICTNCGAGDGVSLVQKLKGLDFLGAKDLIERQIGKARYDPPKARRSEDRNKAAMASLWQQARALDGHDVASRYLTARGIRNLPAASCVRSVPGLAYVTGKVITRHPGMVAKFVAPEGNSAALHRTFLAEPGVKANVPEPRKMMPGVIPHGGAVRLGPVAETMGVAEGIETAMAAAQRFGLTVWACTSCAALVKWQPPTGCRRIIVMGDLDSSYAGQLSAYSLASRLRSAYFVEVRFTRFHDAGDIDEDFADMVWKP